MNPVADGPTANQRQNLAPENFPQTAKDPWSWPAQKPLGFALKTLILLFLATRLLALGDKPLHHDESLFAYYGFQLAQGNGYHYMPILHGPVLQFLSAGFFILFGDSHFVMRLPAALGGLGLGWIFWLWRRELAKAAGLHQCPSQSWLPWIPVFSALSLLAVSPSITFYSRFLRNDAPYLAATILCALLTLRAFRDGRPRDLLYAILSATLMFCMMESSIFFFVACLGFLSAIILAEFFRGPGFSAKPEGWLAGLSATSGTIRLIAFMAALQPAAEIMVRSPLAWPSLTTLVLAVFSLSLIHILFAQMSNLPGTLCADLRRMATSHWSLFRLGYGSLVILTALPLILPSRVPAWLHQLTHIAPMTSFTLLSLSVLMFCAVVVQAVAGRSPAAQPVLEQPSTSSSSVKSKKSKGKASAKSAADSSPPATLGPKALALALPATGLAAVGTLLFGWLYWRIFMDTIPVWAPFQTLGLALGFPLTQQQGTGLAAATLSILLLMISFAYLWVSRHPSNSALSRFVEVIHRSRTHIFLAIAISVFAYQTLFTTVYTHTVDKTFNHTIRDFAQPMAPLTPVQIYKNTWDYWWDQHREHRIKGPFHYYQPILALYEWPAVIAVAFWLGAFLLRRTPNRWVRIAFLFAPHLLVAALLQDLSGRIDWKFMDDKFHVTHPLHVHMALAYLQIQYGVSTLLWRAGRRTEAFLLFYMITQLFAYSYAGEKVPWLSIHTAGPLLLLAGISLGRLARHWASHPPKSWTTRRILGASAAVFILLFQGKSVISACFLWPYSPRERIVFNHTTPDVEWAVAEIERLGIVTGQGSKLSLFIDGEMAWPLYWYFRHRPEAFEKGGETLATTRRPVILCDWNDVVQHPFLGEQYRVVRLKVREWWEPPLLDWRVLADIHLALTARESRQVDGTGQSLALRLRSSQREWIKIFRYVVYREIFLDPANPDFSNSGNEFALAIRKDLDPGPRLEYLLGTPFRREIPIVR
jgi:uncharacterized protein (TIGR03663 family)